MISDVFEDYEKGKALSWYSTIALYSISGSYVIIPCLLLSLIITNISVSFFLLQVAGKTKPRTIQI